MNDTTAMLLAGLAGLGLGCFFFGGLWWTALKSARSNHPGMLHLTSLMVRMGMTLAGFYAVGGGHWQRIVSCLVGFVIARLLVVRLTDTSTAHEAPSSDGGRRASQP